MLGRRLRPDILRAFTFDRNFAEQGITLLGRLRSGHGRALEFADDLAQSIAYGDAAYRAFLDLVDAYRRPTARDRYPDPPCISASLRRLDTRDSGLSSVIWATGAGQLPASGTIPMTGVLTTPPNRFAVKFDIEEQDRALFLAPGAAGDAAIYTQHLHAIHIIRKVILRVGAKLNYIIPKLH